MTKHKHLIGGLVLAAGRGVRMQSALPKTMHVVAGKPMVEHVTDALAEAGVDDICLVLPEDLSAFKTYLVRHPTYRVCIQKDRRGTGDAVAATVDAYLGVKKPAFAQSALSIGSPRIVDYVLICTGDAPAVKGSTLGIMIRQCLDQNVPLAVVGMRMPDPKGYGRLLTTPPSVSQSKSTLSLERIVEENDADAATKQIALCNTGVFIVQTALLFDLLGEVKPNNIKQEYYLTDIVAVARSRGVPVRVIEASDYKEFSGINDPAQLQEVERAMAART